MTDFRMPSLGADMAAGTVVAWHVAGGDTVTRGQIIAEVETEKGVFDLEAPADGSITEVVVQTGVKVSVGTVLAHIARPGEAPSGVAQAPAVTSRPSGNGQRSPESPPPEPARGLGAATRLAATRPPRVAATPLARRIAAARGIDLSSITGTGPRGAVTKEDLERAVPIAAPKPAETETAEPRSAEPAAESKSEEQSAEGRAAAIRSAIARAVSLSWREIPHYYLTLDVDLAATIQWLRSENERRSLAERLLPATILVRSVARALRDFPDLNGFWIDDAMHRSEAVNVALVIARRGGGIVAPALHDPHELSVDALNSALLDLVQRSRTGRLRGSEMIGASVTITSLGDDGATSVHGVIYPPQVALVGFGGITNRPWATGDLLGVRPVVTMTLAADHRATDGHYGSRFLAAVAKRLQHPGHP